MTDKFKIVVENSAPSQAKPAKSVVWASQKLSKIGIKKVVCIGCGRLRNLKVLQKFFERIMLVDTKLQCERIIDLVPNVKNLQLLNVEDFKKDRQEFEVAFLISVLHIIPDMEKRKELISLAVKKLNSSGYLVVDVPTMENYYRQKCTDKNVYNDGWVMGSGIHRTFYKNYTAKELDVFLTSGFPLKLYEKIWFDKHIVRIMEKKTGVRP